MAASIALSSGPIAPATKFSVKWMVARYERTGRDLVGEHDFLAKGIVTEYRDGVAALHTFPRHGTSTALVIIDLDLIPVQL